MDSIRIALTLLGSASVALTQCDPAPASPVRLFDPWAVTIFYASANGDTRNQFVDLSVEAPLTVHRILTTSYDQGMGGATPPDQRGNVAEVRVYTTPTTHVGQEGVPSAWTHVASGEMTLVSWRGDCITQNFKDPSTGAPFTFVLPVGDYGVCLRIGTL